MIQPICAVASGSGGHIIPCITFAHTYAQQHAAPLLFIGNSGNIETTVQKHCKGVQTLFHVDLPKVPYRSWWKMPLFGLQVLGVFFKSLRLFRKEKPQCIITTGGHIALPICLAAWFLQIPIDLFELNVEPGRTINLLAPCARTIFVCFKEAQVHFRKKTVVIPYPLRFTPQDKAPVTGEKPVLLILGGSQGSSFLNTILKKLNPLFLQQWSIIHQTGSADLNDVTTWYNQHDIQAHVFSYHHNLADYYNQTTVVICRAGAGTIFETLFFEKPCIIIPLETTTTNHQLANAQAAYAEYPHLVTTIRQAELEKNPTLLQEMLQKKLETHQVPAFDSSDHPSHTTASV